MSTQQDIYAAGSGNRPSMLNKENYVPWSSRLLRYAKSRPNGKLIYNSIINGPYVRRMIHYRGWRQLVGNQFRKYSGQNVGNQNRCYNCKGLGHLARNCTIRPRRTDAAYLGSSAVIVSKEKKK
ncbi:retrovirus-related pol polyprotein from transposon TNT 1-94 [Tanacetum coccineum]|uniref:Retrovirus-related pol polyprotein from transposon TNT 1-94 n=1 Tax=Tanacetum coccineum TaxID=301880 RepID=A0ABQ5E3N8_9ASTR